MKFIGGVAFFLTFWFMGMCVFFGGADLPRIINFFLGSCFYTLGFFLGLLLSLFIHGGSSILQMFRKKNIFDQLSQIPQRLWPFFIVISFFSLISYVPIALWTGSWLKMGIILTIANCIYLALIKLSQRLGIFKELVEFLTTGEN